MEVLARKGKAYLKIEHDIVVPELRGYPMGDYIPSGSYNALELYDMIKKEFLVEPVPVEISTQTFPEEGGTIIGGGTHYIGEKIKLKAVPKDGYEFLYWSTGDFTDEIEVTVTGDGWYGATFVKHATIWVLANPAEGAITHGTGRYEVGKTINIGIEPKPHFTFLEWNDGSSELSRTIEVTSNSEYIAYLEEDPKVDIITSVTGGEGTVLGGGTYYVGEDVLLTVVPDSDYIFLNWSDGSSEEVRSFIASEDLFLEARLDEKYPKGTIEVFCYPSEGGTTFGSGKHLVGSQVEIGVVPAEHWSFHGWSDGDCVNPKTIEVTSRGTVRYVAEMIEDAKYTVDLSTSEGGYVFGAGEYYVGDEVTIQAVPSNYWLFDKWSDGSTEAKRTFTVTDDIHLVAHFKKIMWRMSVFASPEDGAEEVIGSGSYEPYSEVTLEVKTKPRWRFVRWDDYNTENPRTVIADRETRWYQAILEEDTSAIVVVDHYEMNGETTGSGRYYLGDDVEIEAHPYTNYKFEKWVDQDDNVWEENPLKFVLEKDVEFRAYIVPEKLIKVNINSEGMGDVTGINVGDVSYEPGTRLYIKTLPNYGYRYVNWTNEHGIEINNDDSFTYEVHDDLELNANFTKVNDSEDEWLPATIVTDGDGGWILHIIRPGQWGNQGTGWGMTYSFERGETVQLTADFWDDPDHMFVEWRDSEGNFYSNDNIITFPNAEKQIYMTAVGRRKSTVTIKADDMDNIVEIKGTGVVPQGFEHTIEVVPKPHWSFSYWLEDGNTDNPRTIVPGSDSLTYTAVVVEDDKHPVTVKLSNEQADTISMKAWKNGLLLYSGVKSATIPGVYKEDVLEFEVINSDSEGDYRFVEWSTGETSTRCTLTNITEDTVLIAEISEKPTHKVTITSNATSSHLKLTVKEGDNVVSDTTLTNTVTLPKVKEGATISLQTDVVDSSKLEWTSTVVNDTKYGIDRKQWTADSDLNIKLRLAPKTFDLLKPSVYDFISTAHSSDRKPVTAPAEWYYSTSTEQHSSTAPTKPMWSWIIPTEGYFVVEAHPWGSRNEDDPEDFVGIQGDERGWGQSEIFWGNGWKTNPKRTYMPDNGDNPPTFNEDARFWLAKIPLSQSEADAMGVSSSWLNKAYVCVIASDGDFRSGVVKDVSPDALVELGSSYTIYANPNPGFKFSAWMDGDTSNPRTITIPKDATKRTYIYRPIFGQA